MSNISKKNNYRFAILGSTNGSIVPSLISGIKQISLDLNLDLEIPVIISNKPQAGILDKADLFNIKKEIVISDSNLKREDYDKKLDIILQNNKVDFILLSGFMRILSEFFCNKWKNRVLNIHPSLLPKYQGLMDLSVHQAVLDNKDNKTGCSVHFVTADVDAGPVISQKEVVVESTDDAINLKKRVQSKEAECYLEAIKSLFK